MLLTRRDLFPYQVRFSDFIIDHPFCAGWLDMGLGKTVSTLTAFVDLKNWYGARKMLVVGPLRVARKVWSDEVKRWAHLRGLRVSLIIGSPQQRWEAMWRDADIYCVNRENVPWIEAQFIEGVGKKLKQLRRWPWDVVTIDESQSFRGMEGGGVRFESMRRIRRYLEVERLIELTGTPAPNGYTNLWGQIQLLDLGERLGCDYKQFVNRWFNRKVVDASYTTYELRDTAKDEIHSALSDIVLAMRVEDYLGSPPVVYNDVRVELSTRAMGMYKELKRKALLDVKGKKITAVNAGVLCGKLLQLANGAVYYDDKRNWVHIHDEKLEALGEVLDGASGPVMIAYGFKHDMSRLREFLDKYCGRSRSYRFLNTTKDEDDWNSGLVDYLVLHPAGAGHGLNLQHSGSETIVWFGLTANWEWYTQLNNRLIGGHRAKGKNIVIHRIVADKTYDEEMLPLLATKDGIEDELMRSLSGLITAER